jgi:cell shape-determining protein MreD
MSDLRNNNITRILFEYFPMILLFVSVMNDFDFNDVGLKYFSFNFSYILIFYYTLKRKEALGYISLFIAGLFNDVIVGLPMGISSLLFLLLCGFASYLRNITLRPNLIKDWIFFLITLLIINSFSYISLVFIFEYDINHTNSIVNTLFTFIFYIFFTYIFHFIENFFIGYRNAE